MSTKNKLNKDLVHAIEWAAAEFNYIEDLKKELNIINDDDVEKEVKEISESIAILKYVSRAERRAAKFEEQVEQDLKEFYAELSTHLGFDFSFKQELMQIIRELGIEHDALVKYTSIYEGLLRQELSKAEAEAQLLADIKDDSKEGERIHGSLLNLIKKIKGQVKNAEEWVSALEASLKKAADLINKETAMNLMGKPINVSKLLTKEAKRSKLLAHVIFSSGRFKGVVSDKAYWHRKDLELFRKLSQGEVIGYIPSYYSFEFALSLHVWNVPHGELSFGYKNKDAQGMIIFNDKFYDELCVGVSDTNLLKLFYNILELCTKYGFTTWGSHTWIEKNRAPPQGHRLLYAPNDNINNDFVGYKILRRLAEYRMTKIKEFDKWLEYKGDDASGNPILEPVNIMDKLTPLLPFLKSINGIPLHLAIEKYGGGGIYFAILSVIGLRAGTKYKLSQVPHIKKLEELYNKENLFQLSASNLFSTNTGARALQLTKSGDLRAVPYSLEDVRYFITYDGKDWKNAKVLISPKE